MPGPLEGVRVLDLSRIMAGPWASQILADLGADVIKVEMPRVGDDTRGWGPPFLSDADGNPTSDAGYFLSVNRGKRSICLDLREPTDVETVKAIARQSDVVLENFKVGGLAAYGLDAVSLRAECPSLVFASITGFGQDGPRASQPAYDFMIQAMGGLMSVTGEKDGEPGGGPQKVGIPIVDLMTGMYAAVAILAALNHRSRTGQGETIDVAMLDVMSAILSNQAMNFFLSGNPPVRNGNSHPNIQPQNVYPCQTGNIALAVGNDEQFRRFCAAAGLDGVAEDARFSTNAARVENLGHLNSMIRDALADAPMAEWAERLASAQVPCGPINTVPDVFAEPQVVHRQMVRDLPHAAAGTVKSVVSPMRFAEAPLSFRRGPPALDEHRAEILGELLDG